MEVEMMHKRLKIRSVAILVSMLLLMSTSAQAALLATGQTHFPAFAEPGQPSAGATQLASINVPFAAPGSFVGTLSSTVYTNDATNPFGLGAMTFVYQLNNGPTSSNVLARVVLDSFGGWQTDTGYQPGTGVAPTLVDRLTNPDIGWSFNAAGAGPIPPGASSAMLVIQTDAPFWGASNGSVIDGAQVTGIPALGPAIPEPASLGLLAVAGLLLARRR